MTPEDVHIEFQDGMLKVSGEKKGGGQRTEERAGTRVHRSERTFSSFTRWVSCVNYDALCASWLPGLILCVFTRDSKESGLQDVVYKIKNLRTCHKSHCRSFALPENAKEEGISATLTNGVLSVNV